MRLSENISWQTLLSLGSGAPEGPQNDYVCFKLRHIAFLASNFDISAVYGLIGPCFGYDAPLGLYYHTCRAHAPITSFRGPWGPLNWLCSLRTSINSCFSLHIEIHITNHFFFLAATGQLYKRVCRSVGRSVGPFYLAFLASNFDISAVYGPIGLCFGYDAPVGFCYHISRAHGPITKFRDPWGPLKRLSASNFEI